MPILSLLIGLTLIILFFLNKLPKRLSDKEQKGTFWLGIIFIIAAIIGMVNYSRLYMQPESRDNTEISESDTSKQQEPATIFGSGIHRVGIDIEPGLYRSEEGVTYWARLNNIDDDFESIITNGALIEGQIYVEILKSDEGFESRGDGRWQLVDEDYSPEPVSSFGDGMYLVGIDIEPGTYTSKSGAVSWSIVKDFRGQEDSIIKHEYDVRGSVTITLSESDYGFQSVDANWEKKDK